MATLCPSRFQVSSKLPCIVRIFVSITLHDIREKKWEREGRRERPRFLIQRSLVIKNDCYSSSHHNLYSDSRKDQEQKGTC